MRAVPTGPQDCKGNFAGSVMVIMPDDPGKDAPPIVMIG